MVTWKQKYQDLKKSRQTGLLGSITGALNRIGRSLPTLAANLASGVIAIAPFVNDAIYHLPRGEFRGFAEALNRDYNPIDLNQPFFINKSAVPTYVAPMAIQAGKKVVQKVGSWL